MNRRKASLGGSLFLVAAALGAQVRAAGPDAEKMALIREVLVVTGTEAMMEQSMQQMLENFKTSMPQGSQVLDRLKGKFRAAELIPGLIEIYDRHLSKEDIRALLQFYRSPAGQRVLKEMPAVLQESMAAGQAWGKKKGEEVMRELEEEEKRNSAPPKTSGN